jgi:hypothetical protein
MHDYNNILIIHRQRFGVIQNLADRHLDDLPAYCLHVFFTSPKCAPATANKEDRSFLLTAVFFFIT